MTATELGEHLKAAIPRVIEEEIEEELKEMRGRIEKRVMDRLGHVKTNIEQIDDFKSARREIVISVTIGGEPK